MTSGEMRAERSRRAVFLDRDGTLIVEKNYLGDPAHVVMLPGVAEGLKILVGLGLVPVVVSNQSGVGRSYFTIEDARRVNDRVDMLLRDAGVVIAGWYFCPHRPDAACRCRKPAPGMIEDACRDLHLDARTSFMIGDKPVDLELAAAVGARGLLVTTGYGAAWTALAEKMGVPVCDSFLDAARFIEATIAASA